VAEVYIIIMLLLKVWD